MEELSTVDTTTKTTDIHHTTHPPGRHGDHTVVQVEGDASIIAHNDPREAALSARQLLEKISSVQSCLSEQFLAELEKKEDLNEEDKLLLQNIRVIYDGKKSVLKQIDTVINTQQIRLADLRSMRLLLAHERPPSTKVITLKSIPKTPGESNGGFDTRALLEYLTNAYTDFCRSYFICRMHDWFSNYLEHETKNNNTWTDIEFDHYISHMHRVPAGHSYHRLDARVAEDWEDIKNALLLKNSEAHNILAIFCKHAEYWQRRFEGAGCLSTAIGGIVSALMLVIPNAFDTEKPEDVHPVFPYIGPGMILLGSMLSMLPVIYRRVKKGAIPNRSITFDEGAENNNTDVPVGLKSGVHKLTNLLINENFITREDNESSKLDLSLNTPSKAICRFIFVPKQKIIDLLTEYNANKNPEKIYHFLMDHISSLLNGSAW